MKAVLPFLALAAAAACIACGGGSPEGELSLYMGTYIGSWQAATTGGSGAATILVSPNGSVSGVLAASDATPEKTVEGTVSNGGVAHVTVSSGSGSSTMTGQATRLESGGIDLPLSPGSSYNPEGVTLTIRVTPGSEG